MWWTFLQFFTHHKIKQKYPGYKYCHLFVAMSFGAWVCKKNYVKQQKPCWGEKRYLRSALNWTPVLSVIVAGDLRFTSKEHLCCPSLSINWFIITLMVNIAIRFDYSCHLWTAIQMLWTHTEPRNVLVVPGQSLLAARVQGSSARHPPESVNVGADVEVRSPQKAHSSKALFSCKHTRHIIAGWAFTVELHYIWIVVLQLISHTLR